MRESENHEDQLIPLAWSPEEGSISVLKLISSEVLWFCENDHVETREPRRQYYMKKNYLEHLLPCCIN